MNVYTALSGQKAYFPGAIFPSALQVNEKKLLNCTMNIKVHFVKMRPRIELEESTASVADNLYTRQY